MLALTLLYHLYLEQKLNEEKKGFCHYEDLPFSAAQITCAIASTMTSELQTLNRRVSQLIQNKRLRSLPKKKPK